MLNASCRDNEEYDYVQVNAAGTGYSIMVLKQDGSVWATGANWKGQLGDQSRTTRRSFVLVQIFPDGGKAIATGG